MVPNQHGVTDDEDEPDQRPPRAEVEVRNAVVSSTVSHLVQAHTIGTVELHNHAGMPAPPMPRQLRPAPRGFVGRLDLLAELDRRVSAARDDPPDRERTADPVVISAIGGTGGIGKTWLALTWAHRNLHRFPDGQLAADLHGFGTGEPTRTVDVLADFLAALGVDRDHHPIALDARAALYRTHTAGKRMLILLDNAATADQVVPLLPSGSCTVLVTSRNRLRSLVARDGAYPVHLDVLTDTESRTLLTAALGDTHPIGAQRSITELIDLCGGLPLALGLTASRIRTHPHLLDDLVAELHDLGLGALDSEDPTASLPTVLSWSLRRLTDRHREMFGLLGIAPGPDITLPAAAALTALPTHLARTALFTLEEASLLERRPHGRYAMHDLVRDYAATTATDLTEQIREDALRRVLDFHTHTAHAADQLLQPHVEAERLDPAAPVVHPQPLPDATAALVWFDAEHSCLLAAQRIAADRGWHRAVWQLAYALQTFQSRRGHAHDRLTVWQAAAEAAAHLPDTISRIRAHRALGYSHAGLGHLDEGLEHLQQALVLAEHHPSAHQARTQQAHIHGTIAGIWAERGDDRQTLEHVRRAMDLYRGLDQPEMEAHALNRASWYATLQGEYDTARDHCQAALILYRRLDITEAEADAHHNLGDLNHHEGHHSQAADHYRQALTLFRRLGDTFRVAITLERLGHPHVSLGEHGQARAAWQEALQTYQNQARHRDAARVLRELDDLDRDRPP